MAGPARLALSFSSAVLVLNISFLSLGSMLLENRTYAADSADSQKPNASTIAGDIVSVSGTVYLRGDAKSVVGAKMRTAKQGDTVYVQDVINTGSDGRIKVLMRDKSIIDLGPSALFKVEDFKGKKGAADREVEVSMVYGTMRAAVTQKLEGKGKFKVRTPSATMGVRGTEFVVKSEIHDLKEVNSVVHNTQGTLPPSHLADASAPQQASTQVSVLQGQVDVGKKDFNASAATAGRNPASSGVVSLKAGTQIIAGRSDTPLAAPQTMNATQMKSLSSEAKVVDTTFKNAVVIENAPNNSNGGASNGKSDSGRSPASAPVSPDSLHQVLASAELPLPPPPAVKPADMNIPGSLGPTQVFNQPNINTQGATKHLHIVISTN